MTELKREQIRDKYLTLASSNGTDAAISALHQDITKHERKVFSGGYDKKRLQLVEFMRAMARELFRYNGKGK